MVSSPFFLHSISKYACCSGECFVLALVYIDRIIQSNPTFVVNSLNIHRLLITRFVSRLPQLLSQWCRGSPHGRGCVVRSCMLAALVRVAVSSLLMTPERRETVLTLTCDVPLLGCPCAV